MEILAEILGPASNLVTQGLRGLATWAPVWLPLFFIALFWKTWLTYIRAQFISKMEWTLLEIKLPQEVSRSPLAMELVLNSLQMTFGEAQWIDKYIKGGVRPWTSLELVSLGGSVHFFVWIVKGSRKIFESQIYAEYPDAEMYEVPDYTAGVNFDAGTMKLWGCEFALTKPDPYPIKTYVDYGLDRDPKEEQKIDPITPALEWLGSLGSNEQGWIQIIVRAHKDEDPKRGLKEFTKMEPVGEKSLFGKKGPLFGKTDKWKDDVKKEVQKIVDERKIKGDDEDKGIKLTKLEEEIITALERSISKPAFDVGIRGLYFASSDEFDPANIGGLIGSFKQYSTNHLNGFKPKNTTGVSFPWQDLFGTRVPKKKRAMLDAYKRRSYFHPPHKSKHFILNTEELATIYHFPGKVATTPTLKRLESRKAEPPPGLPI